MAAACKGIERPIAARPAGLNPFLLGLQSGASAERSRWRVVNWSSFASTWRPALLNLVPSPVLDDSGAQASITRYESEGW